MAASTEASAVVDTFPDIAFGNADGRPILLDLYLPKDRGPRVPLVVHLHGGGWRGGSRTFAAEERLVPLAARGLAVASVGYRLSPEAKFPAQLHDSKGAIRWLRANAGEYGIDPRRVGVLGASSGGHLASLVGLTPRYDRTLEGNVGGHLEESSSVGAVVALFPVVDPGLWDEETETREPPAAGTFAARLPSWPPPRRGALLLGVERVDDAPRLAKLANPLEFVDGQQAPPFLILHGDCDSAVSLRHSRLLHDALINAGQHSSLLVLTGVDHEAPEFAEPEILGAIAGFFHDVL